MILSDVDQKFSVSDVWHRDESAIRGWWSWVRSFSVARSVVYAFGSVGIVGTASVPKTNTSQCFAPLEGALFVHSPPDSRRDVCRGTGPHQCGLKRSVELFWARLAWTG